MGCAQSRIENEEAVSRCKERKVFMKEAVAARNGFAAAHSSYTMALKNAGAALSDFGQGESHDPLRPTADPTPADAGEIPPPPPMDTLPPPPPPLPDFSPSPLQRSASMPDLPKKFTARIPNTAATAIQEEDADDSVEAEAEADLSADPSTPPPPPTPPRSTPITESKGMDTWDYFFSMDENMAAEIRPEGLEISPEIPGTPIPGIPTRLEMETPMQTPEKLVVEMPVPPSKLAKKLKQQGGTVLTAHHEHAASAAGALETKRAKVVVSASASTPQSLSLLQVLTELDDHFLKASESSHEVSKMLEANRMHYHSNFADNRGHIDHSARVMRVITWNRSFKGIPNANDGKDDFDNHEWETHATVLDKMLAWEKKLYEEVKTDELMKMEYQRKVMLLNKQKKRGSNPEAIEKTKAAVSHLHTRYIVDMQSMDSTVSEIQHLRDHQLYPKLMELVDKMGSMWETMHTHHDSQLKIVSDLRALDISNAPKETSEHHYSRTVQLCDIVREWHAQFQKFMSHQKEYIKSLNSWLKLNLIPIESNLKEKVMSPPRPHHPPIQALLHAWHDYLEKLPDDLAKSAITSFSAVISTIMMLQQEELKQKEKWEETRKEYLRKSRAFEDWCHKYLQSRKGEGRDADGAEGGNLKDSVAEKRFIVEALKTRLDDDDEAHKKLCKQVREKTLGSLRTHLPELFRAMSDFSRANSEMYRTLKSTSQTQNQNQGAS